MTTYNDSAGNVTYLADRLDIPPVVAKGWLRAEGQAVANPTNPLNILAVRTPQGTYHPTVNQTGVSGRFGTYHTAAAGLADAVRIVTSLSYYSALRAAIKHGNAIGIARAIEDSPWAGGHYGGGGAKDGTIVRYVTAHGAPPHVPQPAVRVYIVKAGDTLSSISRHFYGTTTLWRRIYEANRRIIGQDPDLIRPGQKLHIPPKGA